MILSQTAEYAMRAMTAIATSREECPCRTRDISTSVGIPMHYLSKIMRKLVEAGLLVSQKGHGGGFVLARPADQIRFIEILKAAEFEVEPKACVFGWGRCDAFHPCPLHPIWAKLKSSFVEWAETYTLADVDNPGREPLR